MKARTPTPLFEQAHIAPLRALTPTPLPRERGPAPPLPFSPLEKVADAVGRMKRRALPFALGEKVARRAG